MPIQLGDKAKDKVSGFKGIVITRCEYLSCGTRLGLQAEVGADGKMEEVKYFDECMLDVVEEQAVKAAR